MRPRPRRPYKNFGLFCWDKGSDNGKPYPCLACRGRGFFLERNGTAFVAYAPRTICTACRGTGHGTKQACQEAYDKVLAEYRDKAQAYNNLAKVRTQARKKLTKEEIKALKELGL